MNIAIIPARGGSKRIPKKNIKLFSGKPLIAYSIETAKASNLFDQIIVSTDSEEIATVAKQYGASVPFLRPTSLADDYTGTTPVTRHAIEHCLKQGFKPEFACCIYATAPFLQSEYLAQGLNMLKEQKNKAFAFSVTSFAFPVQRGITIDKTTGLIQPLQPECMKMRSQDLPEAFHDAGQFYWGRCTDYLQGGKGMFSEHSLPVVLPRHLVQDIDTPEDWQRAELMYQAYIQPQI